MRLLKQFYLPHWRWFAGGTFFAVVTSLAVTSYGLLIKNVGDNLQATVQGGVSEGAGVPNWVWFAVGGIVIAALVRSVSLYLMTILNNIGVQEALVDVQDAQFASLTDGDFARLSANTSGGFVSRFINDVNSLRDAGLRLANNFTKGVVTVIAALGGLLYMDWQLTLILLVAYPLAFGPVISLGNRVRQRAKKAQRQVGEVTSLLSEGFQSARIVKAYSLEKYQKDRARLGFMERAKLFLKVLKDKAAVDPILEIAGGVAIAGIMGFSAWRIATGASTIGDLLGFIALIGVASPELRALGTLNAVAQEGAAAADRVYDVLDAPARIADVPGAETLQAESAAIAFRDVHFSYPDGSPALKGLSFSAEPGETIALVAPVLQAWILQRN